MDSTCQPRSWAERCRPKRRRCLRMGCTKTDSEPCPIQGLIGPAGDRQNQLPPRGPGPERGVESNPAHALRSRPRGVSDDCSSRTLLDDVGKGRGAMAAAASTSCARSAFPCGSASRSITPGDSFCKQILYAQVLGPRRHIPFARSRPRRKPHDRPLMCSPFGRSGRSFEQICSMSLNTRVASDMCLAQAKRKWHSFEQDVSDVGQSRRLRPNLGLCSNKLGGGFDKVRGVFGKTWGFVRPSSGWLPTTLEPFRPMLGRFGPTSGRCRRSSAPGAVQVRGAAHRHAVWKDKRTVLSNVAGALDRAPWDGMTPSSSLLGAARLGARRVTQSRRATPTAGTRPWRARWAEALAPRRGRHERPPPRFRQHQKGASPSLAAVGRIGRQRIVILRLTFFRSLRRLFWV